MKTVLHKANTRGHADHGWLDSHHTFSFAGYNNPQRNHFGLLRVLNDDHVARGMGFGTHPHDNMEIVSIPLSGALEHKDSTGRHKIIKSGEVQIMSAGTGIYHSEMNASKEEPVKFLQIWVFPKQRNIAPRYEQKEFDKAGRLNQLQTLVSPEENAPSIWINQDAWFVQSDLEAGKQVEYKTHLAGNGVYVFVLDGDVKIGDQQLSTRDGLGVTDTDAFTIEASSNASVLFI